MHRPLPLPKAPTTPEAETVIYFDPKRDDHLQGAGKPKENPLTDFFNRAKTSVPQPLQPPQPLIVRQAHNRPQR